MKLRIKALVHNVLYQLFYQITNSKEKIGKHENAQQFLTTRTVYHCNFQHCFILWSYPMGSCCHFLLPAPRVFLVFCFSPVLLPSLIFSLQLYHIGLLSTGLFPCQHLIPYLDEFVSKPVLFPQSLSVCLSVSCAPVPVCWSSCILCVPDFLMVSCLVRSFCIAVEFHFLPALLLL